MRTGRLTPPRPHRTRRASTTAWTGAQRFISPPTDDEEVTDGEPTKKCVAYRRFVTELINTKYAYLTDTIPSTDPNHLLTAQRVAFVSVIPFSDKTIAYPLRHTIAYLDYFGYTFSPHDTWGLWDENEYRTNVERFRKQGFAIRCAACNKPVIPPGMIPGGIKRIRRQHLLQAAPGA